MRDHASSLLFSREEPLFPPIQYNTPILQKLDQFSVFQVRCGKWQDTISTDVVYKGGVENVQYATNHKMVYGWLRTVRFQRPLYTQHTIETTQ